MNPEFLKYAAIVLPACLAAGLIVGRKLFDPARSPGPYFAMFVITYVLRPAGTQWYGDIYMYKWLRIGSFAPYWFPMAVAVSGAVVCFAIGYRFAIAKRSSENHAAGEIAIVSRDRVLRVARVFIALGYLGLLVTMLHGGTAQHAAIRGAGNGLGVHTRDTAWIIDTQVFVSTGTVIYYVVTGRLGMSFLLAAPWLGYRVYYGWARIYIIAHLLSLTAAYFGRARYSKRNVSSLHLVLLASGVAVTVMLLFPLLSILRALQLNGCSFWDISPQAVKILMNDRAGAEGWFSSESDLAGFEQTVYYLAIDQKPALGVDYFWNYFIRPIPRILWPGKGTFISWDEKLRGIPYDPRPVSIGMAPGAIGIAFKEWRWPGIVLEFLFTGMFFRGLEEWSRRNPGKASAQTAYVGLYGMIPQLGRDSLIWMISVRYLFVIAIPLFFVWVAEKPTEGRTGSADAPRGAIRNSAIEASA